MPQNILVVHDTQYEITPRYRAGAQAFRDSVPWSSNPHRYGTQSHEEWNYGHENESCGEHFRFGKDLMAVARNGERHEMDPTVPRDKDGTIDDGWVSTQRKSLRTPATAS